MKNTEKVINKNIKKQSEAYAEQDISTYINNQEYIANNYVMKCFTVTIIMLSIVFVLNILGIFVVQQQLMSLAYFPSLIIYLIVLFISKKVDMSDGKIKYFILFSAVLVFTNIGIFITYHVVLLSLLPFLYATLYSSKRIMRYVYCLTVLSTIIIVYGGYYFGLCDANMTLLTTGKMYEYISQGKFILDEVNSNPSVNLMLFFVVPRCLTYVAFVAVGESIFSIVSRSLERARLTEELEHAKNEAERANKAKTQFLARMSHEIRTPINAIIGMNEMIIAESDSDQIQDYAYDVKSSSAMLLSIINEILDSTKIESGMMEIIPVKYRIASMLNDLYNIISVKANEKELKLEFDIDSNIPREYVGDDKRIRQVLINILNNAVKYTEKGSVTLKLTCVMEGDKAILKYSVRDTGMGIRAEDIGKIYDAFQRLDISKNKNVEGSGLGMNITQQILKLMDSELSIQSEYGKGSDFSFEIVQKVVDKEPLGDFRNRIENVDKYKSTRIKFSAPDARILVVDDQEMNLKVFVNLVKNTGMQVDEAMSGRECLNLLEKKKYDIVFLDHMMPEMDGIETLKHIKSKRLCEDTPIIMLTANAMTDDRNLYVKEGFDDFFLKPILPEKLDKMIIQYLPEELVHINNMEAMKEKDEEVIDEMNSEDGIDNIKIIDMNKAMTYCCGDKTFFRQMLKEFVQMPIKEQLNEFFEKNDHKNYSIKVHSFKNSSYTIGATEIGDIAFKLEQLTKNGFSESVPGLQEEMFVKYDAVCRLYDTLL